MRNILIPTDFSDNAMHAARYAITLFGGEAKYTLMNSFEVPHSGAMLITIADILQKDSMQLLDEQHSKLAAEFPKVADQIEVVSQMGQPSLSILKSAESEMYDLVIMGTTGASGLKEMFLGSVASNTLSDLQIPVIAIPENAEISFPKKILYAADDHSLMVGKLPAQLTEMALKFDSEILILNIVPVGELKHVGNNPELKTKDIGVFENVRHTFHFVEADEVNSGIESFLKGNKVDMLAMITRKKDFFSRLFGRSNTKQMMMHTRVPMVAFH